MFLFLLLVVAITEMVIVDLVIATIGIVVDDLLTVGTDAEQAKPGA